MGLLTGILIFLAGAICGIGGLLVGIIYVLNVRTSKLEKTSTFPNLDPKNIPKEIPILAKPVTVDLGTFRTSDLNEIQRRKLICEIVEANDLFSLDQNGTNMNNFLFFFVEDRSLIFWFVGHWIVHLKTFDFISWLRHLQIFLCVFVPNAAFSHSTLRYFLFYFCRRFGHFRSNSTWFSTAPKN